MGPRAGNAVVQWGKRPTTTVSLRATPGEYEPFSFSFRPHERLEQVFVKPAGALVGQKGQIDVGNVQVCTIAVNLEALPFRLYERAREGMDDLKYLLKLEALIAEAKKAGRGQNDVVRHAETVLRELGDSITDNWTAYSDGGEAWPPARYHEWRWKGMSLALARNTGWKPIPPTEN